MRSFAFPTSSISGERRYSRFDNPLAGMIHVHNYTVYIRWRGLGAPPERLLELSLCTGSPLPLHIFISTSHHRISPSISVVWPLSSCLTATSLLWSYIQTSRAGLNSSDERACIESGEEFPQTPFSHLIVGMQTPAYLLFGRTFSRQTRQTHCGTVIPHGSNATISIG